MNNFRSTNWKENLKKTSCSLLFTYIIVPQIDFSNGNIKSFPSPDDGKNVPSQISGPVIPAGVKNPKEPERRIVRLIFTLRCAAAAAAAAAARCRRSIYLKII